eukprot:TRINITY_DN47017_c0_g1_i1.p1 TRINITY_DN47017_c0_g1~~TRINITY_DN47017_c0_g1_i1.p1  ORF type:complete len:534 (-),score=135.99 TRINITY_DN47017_c0_g1_i1:52-1599(-)
MGVKKRAAASEAKKAEEEVPLEKPAKKAKKQKKDCKLDVEAAKEFFETNGIKIHIPDSKKESIDITPLAGFQCEGFANRLVKYCQGKFDKPTPIQACTWPLIMQRSDVCGIAKTGSGKTMAFAMPYLSMSRLGVLEVFEQPCHTPRFLAMAPTRELAMQIAEVCLDLTKALTQGDESVYPVQCIFGGVPKKDQRQVINNVGIDMCVCTPGRLEDLVEEESLDLSHVQYLVLDEADRMLDMGFIDTVKKLIDRMPKVGKRQTVMFSATWPSSVHSLATQFLSDPLHVGIGSVDEGMVANTAIRQLVEVIRNDKEKPTRLLKHLKEHYAPNKKIIIFGLYKKETAWLESFLHEKGYDKVIALQGDMTQDKRTQAITDFKATKKTPLIATDVASRGLDVQDVELVINYTFPLTIEDYVHRIGRTGRAGKKGLAICFFCPDSKGAQDEKAHAGDLAKVLRDAGQEVPKDLQAIADTSGGNKATKKKAHPLFGAHFKSAEQMAALEAKKVHKTFGDSDDE